MTPKQEAFCLSYIELGNASAAYRRAYDADLMKDTTINRKAKELLDNGNITARIEELTTAHQQRHNITVDSITALLIEDRRLAHKNGQSSAAVSASMGLAKLYGLCTDKAKREATTPIIMYYPEDDDL